MAWERIIPGGTSELLVVSDSRLSGGKSFDCCPKILTLPRSDAFICFAGDTDYAYPLMLQFSMSIENYARSKDRAMDLHDLKTYALKVFNSMRDSVHSYSEGQEIPGTTFIIGGYSWIRKKFSMWKVHFSPKEKRFIFKTQSGRLKDIIFIGDWAKTAEQKLIQRLRDEDRFSGDISLGMEPFEIMRDLLRADLKNQSIGGPPQLVKVWQHMNCKPIGVYWPDKASGKATLMGRTLLEYENPGVWMIDPDTMRTSHVYYSQDGAESSSSRI